MTDTGRNDGDPGLVEPERRTDEGNVDEVQDDPTVAPPAEEEAARLGDFACGHGERGAGCRNRTRDIQFTKLALYQLS